MFGTNRDIFGKEIRALGHISNIFSLSIPDIFKHDLAYKSLEYSLTDLIHGGSNKTIDSPEYMLYDKKKLLGSL